MFTLGHDFIAPRVHGGKLRYHGRNPQVSLLSKKGYFEPRAENQVDVFKADVTSARCKGVLPAPETTYAKS